MILGIIFLTSIFIFLFIYLRSIFRFFYEGFKHGWKTSFLKRGYIIVLTLLIIASCLGGFAYSDRQRKLNFIPVGMSSSKILYSKEHSWGFGPGGNEVGVIVYALSEQDRRNIEKKVCSILFLYQKS